MGQKNKSSKVKSERNRRKPSKRKLINKNAFIKVNQTGRKALLITAKNALLTEQITKDVELLRKQKFIKFKELRKSLHKLNIDFSNLKKTLPIKSLKELGISLQKPVSKITPKPLTKKQDKMLTDSTPIKKQSTDKISKHLAEIEARLNRL